MIKEYNDLSLKLGVPGILLQFAGDFLMLSSRNNWLGTAGSFLLVPGTALLIAGLSYYAIAKERSGWWGLCGFLSIIGLFVLAALEDRSPETAGRDERHCPFCYRIIGKATKTCPRCMNNVFDSSSSSH